MDFGLDGLISLKAHASITSWKARFTVDDTKDDSAEKRLKAVDIQNKSHFFDSARDSLDGHYLIPSEYAKKYRRLDEHKESFTVSAILAGVRISWNAHAAIGPTKEQVRKESFARRFYGSEQDRLNRRIESGFSY
jgi:hypothetical protein